MATAPAVEPGAAAQTTADCCPICFGTDWRTRKELKLYGTRVCKKCYYSLANRRQLAFVLDRILVTAVAYAAIGAVGFFAPSTVTALGGVALLALALACDFLFCLRDSFMGQSPGKMLTGVQTIERETLEPVGPQLSLVRHAPLLAIWAAAVFLSLLDDTIGIIGSLIGLVLLLYMASQLCRGPRWGDQLAGTMVIWKKYRHRVPFDTRGALCVVCGYDLRGNLSGVWYGNRQPGGRPAGGCAW